MRTLRLLVEYDGTDFVGWQQQDGQRSVQACLQDAFAQMVGAKALVRGASRTDAGVHALGQTASVEVESKIPLHGFLRGINAMLPFDVAVVELTEAAPGFDARRDARGKIYRYAIWNHAVRSPMHARTSWHVRDALDIHAMREAAALLVGVHDFGAFRASDCERLSTVREIRRLDVQRQDALVTLDLEGTAFLKYMVRILAGTLVAVGQGKLQTGDVAQLLQSKDRTAAGVTAPAAGLTLARVLY